MRNEANQDYEVAPRTALFKDHFSENSIHFGHNQANRSAGSVAVWEPERVHIESSECRRNNARHVGTRI